MRLLLFILVLFTAVAVITDTKAAEWNEKPVICSTWPELDEALIERGEILFSTAIQTTAVKDGFGGLSDKPAYLPFSIWINPKTKTYTIIEYHPLYDSYCVLSQGTDWNINGEQL